MTYTEQKEESFRGQLARTMTIGAMVVIVVICAVLLIAAGVRAIYSSDPEADRDFLETGKYVLAAVLPVVAGWVGTVVAFYFGKANFEAATKSASDLARQLTSQEKLATTRVESLGHTIQVATKLVVSKGNDWKKVKLSEVKSLYRNVNPPYQRLPIVDADLHPLMVLHYSIFNDFIVSQLDQKKETDPEKLTLGDLVKVYDWLLTKSFVMVQPGSTAADAKKAMEIDQLCKDVYVTGDGTQQTAVLRWITNIHLLEAAKI